jgi:O-methyltransferase
MARSLILRAQNGFLDNAATRRQMGDNPEPSALYSIHGYHASVVKQRLPTWFKNPILRALRKRGYELVKTGVPAADLLEDPHFAAAFAAARPYTMTSPERMHALFYATRYVVQREVPGAIVECGVWKGGSMMVVAYALARTEKRPLYLYDTFAGMSEPSGADPAEAHHAWRRDQRAGFNEWCYSPLDEVRSNLAQTGYPSREIHYVEGKVEDTIPSSIPDEIALLRLDTDWYESTRHELTHLYPRLARGGVLIIDDYGFWQGARRAVDEYFAGQPALLARVDSTGRLVIKT